MDDCIFCQIINGKLPSEKVAETDLTLAFKDIHPKAPVHVLIVPKTHRRRPDELSPKELEDLFKLSREIVQRTGVVETGYRLSFNIGRDAGQLIDHAHLHLLAGRPLSLG